MEFQALPPYRGLPDSLRAWGEPSDHGLLPPMRLRDYVVLCVLILTFAPLFAPLRVFLWDEHWRTEALDAARRQQLQQEVLRELHGPKR
jgi:hypothetical protein